MTCGAQQTPSPPQHCVSMMLLVLVSVNAINNGTSTPFSPPLPSPPLVFPHHSVSDGPDVERSDALAAIKTGRFRTCHYFPEHAHNEFFDKAWDKYLNVPKQRAPVYVYNPCMSTYNLGNSLGNYFNEVACALVANLSLVVGQKMWLFPTMPIEYKGAGGKRPHDGERFSLAFFDGLPDVLWKEPGRPADAQAVRRLCPCDKYCWSHAQAPWIQQHQAIRQLMNRALETHMAAKKEGRYVRGTMVKTAASMAAAARAANNHNNNHTATAAADADRTSNATASPAAAASATASASASASASAALPANVSVNVNVNVADLVADKIKAALAAAGSAGDLCSAEPGAFLPIVPDAAVHYRCGDTVPSNIYGFLPFFAVRDLIPADAKHIYVMTDPPHRVHILADGRAPRFSLHCRPIMVALFEYLQRAFPHAVVLVKSGGDPLVDYYRIARARVAVCSSSTFCLWPAMAATGTAYFPATRLLAGWTPERNATHPLPHLGGNVVWLHRPPMVTEFKEDTPLADVLRVLARPA